MKQQELKNIKCDGEMKEKKKKHHILYGKYLQVSKCSLGAERKTSTTHGKQSTELPSGNATRNVALSNL